MSLFNTIASLKTSEVLFSLFFLTGFVNFVSFLEEQESYLKGFYVLYDRVSVGMK